MVSVAKVIAAASVPGTAACSSHLHRACLSLLLVHDKERWTSSLESRLGVCSEHPQVRNETADKQGSFSMESSS